MSRQGGRRTQRGFTLLEAIIVIVILGVLATAVAVFIRVPIQGYVDSVGRAEISDEADLALRRISRDLRLALPNSIRVSADGAAVEFLPTKTGGRYLAAEDGIDDAPALDFLDGSHTSFTVIGPPGSFGRAAPGDYVVVYNLGEGMAPSDAYQYAGAESNTALITAIQTKSVPAIDLDNASPVITMERNPFASQSTPMPSPTHRFQVVSGPVSYYCAAQQDGTLALWRAWNYKINPVQVVPPADPAQRALVATRLASCAIFDYSSAESRRSGLVLLSLELTARNERDPAIRLVHQVHVDNTP